MSDVRLIDANAAMEKLREKFLATDPKDPEQLGYLNARLIIRNLPTVDAAPVVHSHWVNCEGHTFAPIGARCFCYNCHFYDSEPYNWCHGCGAKMDGGGSK